MEILRINKVRKEYKQGDNTVVALDDISLSINKGEFVAIMGPSGSGKSTLLHILGCVDSPTSGEVWIDDVDIKSLKENNLTIFRRRHIGLVYQFYNLIPILNIEDNIKLPVLLDGRKVNEEYYHELIHHLGLEDRISHLPSELSGGQQQRVSIARALMNQPSILLADEPTGNLDQQTGQEIMRIFKESHDKYKQTIILITHDIEVARQADRILYIEDGKIIENEAI